MTAFIMHGLVTYSFRGLALQASIGLLPAEKAAPQRILIDLEYDCREPKESDDRIESVLDYDAMRKEVVSIAQSRHFNLVETLCGAILARLFEHRQVLRAKVSVLKPDIYSDVDSVGITMETRRR